MGVTGSVTARDTGALASAQLAARLRALRRTHWPDLPVRQADLAAAFDVSPSSISSWEKADAPTIPPEHRLEMYARFFSTRRSATGEASQLLPDSELGDDESTLRNALYRELLALHDLAVGAQEEADDADDLWTFPDGGPIRVVCGVLDPAERGPSADAASRHYVELAATADLDALFELSGHLRMRNPSSDVRFVRADRYDAEDLQAHVVLLGNPARYGGGPGLAVEESIPVRRRSLGGAEGEVFEPARGGADARMHPRFVDERLVEDIGMFARTRNPWYSTRTLTVCGGAYTRGVYGAVRCLTDGGLGEENAAYLRALAGGADTFGVVMRVRTADHIVPTPDLRDPRNRLFEFAT